MATCHLVEVSITVKRRATGLERQLLARALQMLMNQPPPGTTIQVENPFAIEKLLSGLPVPYVFFSVESTDAPKTDALGEAFQALSHLVDNIRVNGRSWHPSIR